MQVTNPFLSAFFFRMYSENILSNLFMRPLRDIFFGIYKYIQNQKKRKKSNQKKEKKKPPRKTKYLIA